MARRGGTQLTVAAAAAVLLLVVLTSIPFECNRVEGFKSGFSSVTLDDAWIHFVYARNLSRGEFFTYNPGQHETGTTSPLWCALIAPFLWLGIAPTTASKILGILSAAALAAFLWRIASRLMSAAFGAAAALVVILDPLLGFAKLSGMEVLLASALVAAATERTLARRLRSASALAGLAVWARPDSLIFAALAVPLAMLGNREGGPVKRGGPWCDGLTIAIGPALAAAAWAIYCKSATGQWLPSTYYIRGQGIGQGLTNVGAAGAILRELMDGSPLFSNWPKLAWAGAGGIAILGSMFTGGGGRSTRALLVLVPLAYLALLGGGVINVIGGSFTGNRYVIPMLPFLVLWALYPIHLIARELSKRLRPKAGAAAAWIAASAALIGLAAPFGHTAQRSRELVDEFTRSALNLARMHVEIGEWVRDNTPKDAVIALYDAGAITYISEREAIDIGGLNNTRFEVYDEGRATADPAWLDRWCTNLESVADLLIIYPNQHPTLARRYSGAPVFSRTVRDPVVSLGDTLTVFDLGLIK